MFEYWRLATHTSKWPREFFFFVGCCCCCSFQIRQLLAYYSFTRYYYLLTILFFLFPSPLSIPSFYVILCMSRLFKRLLHCPLLRRRALQSVHLLKRCMFVLLWSLAVCDLVCFFDFPLRVCLRMCALVILFFTIIFLLPPGSFVRVVSRLSL